MEPTLTLQTATTLLAISALGGLTMAVMRFAGKPLPPTPVAMLHGFLSAAALTLLIYAAATVGLPGRALPMSAPLPAPGLLVNASVLGMAGHPGFAPDLGSLPADAIVYDIVYSPLVTPLLASARARNLATIDGLEMLIGQAALAFTLLFGSTPPGDYDAELRALLVA